LWALFGDSGLKPNDIDKTAREEFTLTQDEIIKNSAAAGSALRTNQPRPLLHPEQPDEWKPVAPSTSQAVPKLAPGIIPRNHPGSPAVDLLKTAMNLLSPRLFGVRVNLDIQTLDQRVDRRGASLRRKR